MFVGGGQVAVTVFGLCALAAGLAPAAQADTVIATVPVGDGPIGVAITPGGTHAYVANADGGSVSVIETATNTVTATIPVGASPFAVAITPNGTHAYVTALSRCRTRQTGSWENVA
ncbi:YncE family protein [Rhodococcus jostii]|uniref:YncE family protein n=1 Tax=Rhodococcus jostii TaxID=132919 RepID=UPI00362D841E